ncbi:MAG: hypothetical protein JWM16_4347 [Verrucomicrobiales bacterium]|nr:hypothetical protein [Verrucomicrobiales bacterium]
MKLYATSFGPVALESKSRKSIGSCFPRFLQMLLSKAGLENVELERKEEKTFRFYRELTDSEFEKVEQLLEQCPVPTATISPRLSDSQRILRNAKLRSLAAA